MMKTPLLTLCGLCTLLVFSHSSNASLALEEWNMTTRMELPLYLKIWLGVMLTTHLLSIAFVKKYNAARWVLGCFIGSHILVFGAEHSDSLVLLGGMVSASHVIFWPPALLSIYLYRAQLKISRAYTAWVVAILFFYSVSLIFDVRDTVIFLNYLAKQ